MMLRNAIQSDAAPLVTLVGQMGTNYQMSLQNMQARITAFNNKNHRGKGIGKKLMAAAEKYAAEHGAIVIELITANHRRKSGTHAFYESLGYKDHSLLNSLSNLFGIAHLFGS